MVWEYERFRGDAAIYAFCPKCHFHHNPSRMTMNDDGKLTSEIMYQYNYCPMCGEYLYDDHDTVEIIWDERNVEALWKMEAQYGSYNT